MENLLMIISQFPSPATGSTSTRPSTLYFPTKRNSGKSPTISVIPLKSALKPLKCKLHYQY